jgi:chemotaxis protein MotB
MPSRSKFNTAKHDETGGAGSWQIVYTSFVLILLSFFILLSSFATLEPAKVMRFTRSFADAVNVLTGGLSFERGRTNLGPASQMADKESELADIFQAVGAYTEALELDKDIQLAKSAKGIVMTLADSALFHLGEAQITDNALLLLDKIGAIISQSGYYVRIEGHTDNLPIMNQRFPSNWDLSTARAVNVLRYFVEQRRIPAKRLSAVGFGEFQPKYPNDTVANLAKNRRVEIIFMAPNTNELHEEAVR